MIINKDKMPDRRLRDFLTGRDDAIRKYDVPFSRLEENDQAGLVRLCGALNREYHEQCRLYKSNIKSGFGITSSISNSLLDFTNAVVEFTEGIGKSMTVPQARTILTSARFLRLCVAGRAVYTERCAEERDTAHIFAENLFGRALVALNNKRADAITTASKASTDEKQKKNKKGKKKKGAAKQTPAKMSNNLFEVLINSVEDIEESMENTELGEQKGGDEEVISFPNPSPAEEEEIDQSRVVQLFVANEIRDMKDTVHDVIQSDHLEDIKDSIWGSDTERNYVHLKALDYIPLPTRDVYEFIHKFPKNRLILLRLCVNIVKSIEEGVFDRDRVAQYFHTLVKFLLKVENSQLELVYTCDLIIFSRPWEETMNRTMRFLRVINNINPLCVAYLAHFPDFFKLVFHEIQVGSGSRVEEMKFFSSVASIFSSTPRVSLQEVMEGKDIAGLPYVQRAMEQALDNEQSWTGYNPTFVMFKDDQSRIDPMSLPVEVLQDDKHVEIKIHDSEVDEYVRGIVSRNEGFCQVFIPSSHIAYFDHGRDEVQYMLKYIEHVTHVDGTRDTLGLQSTT